MLDLLPERIAKRIVVAENGCWEWTGRRTPNGHGFVSWNGRQKPVYRVVHELVTGSASNAEDFDHLCRNRSCCNPDHVEGVTHAENMRRGVQSFDTRTHCLSGEHALTPDNVVHRADGRRACRACRNTRRKP